MKEPTSPKPRSPLGGGAPIALLILAGAVIGGLMGQPTIGLLVGLAIGIVIAILIWRAGSR